MQDTKKEEEFFDNLNENDAWLSVERGSYEKIFRKFERFIDFRRNLNIIEVGCGSGAFTEVLYANLRKPFIATDVSHKAIVNAKKKLPKVKFLVDNIEHSKLSSNYFDIVILSGVLHHFKDKDRVIKEVRRILKINGVVLGYDPNINNPFIWLLRSKNSILYSNKNLSENEEYFSAGELNRLLMSYKFENINIEAIAGIMYTRNHFKKIFVSVFSYLVYFYNFLDYLTEKFFERKYGQWLIYFARKNA